jgi:hypothetical protein
MGMSTSAESSSTEAHLNDLTTRTILEDSGGFMYVMTRQTQLQSQTAVLTIAFDEQNDQNFRI